MGMRRPDWRSSRQTSKHHIEDHKIIGVDGRLIQRIIAARDYIDGIGLFPQALGHEPRNARIIFNEQKPHTCIIRQAGRKVRYLRSGTNRFRPPVVIRRHCG